MNATHRARVVVAPLVGVVLSAALSVSAAVAQAPAISTISPWGVRPGQTQEVIVRGSGLAGASGFRTNFPAKAVLTAKKGNGTRPGDVSFMLSVPAETPPGIYAARVATQHGISPLRIILVDELPVAAAPTGNNSPATAQRISLPAAIDGAIGSLARDYYKFHAEAGQRVSIEILARRIGSPLDPVLRLLDATGREVTYSDDLPGLSEDAALEHTFRAAGDYFVEVGDNMYQGGGDFVYRLRIGDFPSAVVPWPLAVTRGSETNVRFATRSGVELDPARVKAPADRSLLTWNVPVRFPGGATTGFGAVLLSDRKQAVEQEPNNDLKSATRVELGYGLNGRLQTPGDVDRFVFHAQAGQNVRFTGIARTLGSPADVVLRLTGTDGRVISQAEGMGSAEASLSESFPKDGDYVLEVRDLNHRGGPRYSYHVDVAPSQPGFTLTASADALNVPRGGTMLVTITAHRTGYTGPIALAVAGLPPGVSSAPTVMGAGQDKTALTLSAKADAAGGGVYPVQIVGTARIGAADVQASATVNEELKAHFGGMPYPPLALYGLTAVGIGPPPNFTLRTEPATLALARGQSAKVTVVVERQKGFDEEIALTVPASEPAQPGKKPPAPLLPAGVTASLKPIPKGAQSITVTFSADKRPPAGEFTAVLVGTLKKGNTAVSQPAPGIALKLVK